MRVRHYRRVFLDYAMKLIAVSLAGIVLVLLGCILWTVLVRGMSAVSLPILLHSMAEPVEGNVGGIANAVVGSVIQVGLAFLVALPLGVATGTYLSEFPENGRYTAIIGFINDILLSTPSILIGLFVYEFSVRRGGGFSAWSGSAALGLIMLPIIVRSTEEMLRLVPVPLREAAFALGASRYQVIAPVVWKAARSGIATGVLLATARAAGETAPLLFTSVGSPFWSFSIWEPMASLPVMIYQYASSPVPQLVSLAWVGALVITVTVLLLNVLAELIFPNRHL